MHPSIGQKVVPLSAANRSPEPAGSQTTPIDNLDEERPDRPTMIRVWNELTPDEREGLAQMAGLAVGQMSLTKISTVLKVIFYKHNPLFQMQPYATMNTIGQYHGGTVHPHYLPYAQSSIPNQYANQYANQYGNPVTSTSNNTSPVQGQAYSSLLGGYLSGILGK